MLVTVFVRSGLIADFGAQVSAERFKHGENDSAFFRVDGYAVNKVEIAVGSAVVLKIKIVQQIVAADIRFNFVLPKQL